MSYTLKDKRDRNRRLIAFIESHPEMTLRAIAGIFHISHVRVSQIRKAMLAEVVVK